VRHPPQAGSLNVRLVGRETVELGAFELGPSFYPGLAWQPGDVIRQSIVFQLPNTLPAGRYGVQVQLGPETDSDGFLTSSAPPDSGWSGVGSIQVEAPTRRYGAPLLRTRRAVRFGDTLLLQGFRLGKTRPTAGDQVSLTVYWKALQRPDRLYAVFNHLRAEDGTIVWQGDSWPRGGLYTTDHWLRGEVVAETYTLELPETLPPGIYTFYTGVYNPTTGDRLEAMAPSGQNLTHNELALFEWTIKR
jgi:hypothetical protein